MLYLTTLSVTQNSRIISEHVPEMTWKKSGRSLLEAPSERDIGQLTATFLADFVSTSYSTYACCMSYP
jgi:hypothetical protein